MKLDPLADYCI